MTTDSTAPSNSGAAASQAASPHSPVTPTEGHDEWLLDEALAETFPASDSIAVSKCGLALGRLTR